MRDFIVKKWQQCCWKSCFWTDDGDDVDLSEAIEEAVVDNMTCFELAP